ncbi:MAG: cell division protein FtsH, partial [Candidatus Marinimicrobia bacterium]|nr:cell division protein FtsH [Candidatus Neomarinimicrobiota bacterium]
MINKNFYLKSQSKNSLDKKSASQSSKKDKSKSKKGTDNKGSEFKWKKASKTSLMWLVILISSIFLIQILSSGKKGEVVIEFYQYKDLLFNSKIKKATIIDREFHGVLDEKTTLVIGGRPIEVEKFYFILPPVIDKAMLEEWDLYNLNYNFKEKTVKWT